MEKGFGVMNKKDRKFIKELKKMCSEYNFWSEDSMRWTLARMKSKLDEIDLGAVK